MKILLLGEYSNVHWTLACALRKMGHEVCVVSNCDEWKGYSTDIPLIRKPGRWGAITYLYKVLRLLPKLRGYDVVQLINPVHFIDLKAERGIRIYDYLRQHNKRVFLGAFGYDYYLVHDSVVRRTLRYCDFYTPTQEVHHEWNTANEHDWLHTFKKEANIHIAETCDGIISGLYEYDVAYRPYFPEKTTFIPFPIELEHTETEIRIPRRQGQKIRFFIGIQRHRTALKGTDIMLRALERIVADYPDRAEMIKAESVPFNQYKEMMRSSDVLLDQIYSYTPAMNALLAMSQGLILVGGGEEENYTILGEEELRPIINNDKINPLDVGEKQLCQILCAYRIFLPFVGITVSSRESAEFRNGIVKIAATKVSAGVSTGIGDHENKYTGKEDDAVKGDEQFEIDDNRSFDAMYKDMSGEGLQPVLNDYVYV